MAHGLTLVLGVALASQGCGSETIAPTLQLGMADDGTSVEIPVGGTLVVSLRANESLGCEWAIVELDSTVLENTDNRYEMDEPMPGSAATDVWEFEGRSAGTTALRLEQLVYHGSSDPCTNDMVLEIFGSSFEIAVTVVARD